MPMWMQGRVTVSSGMVYSVTGAKARFAAMQWQRRGRPGMVLCRSLAGGLGTVCGQARHIGLVVRDSSRRDAAGGGPHGLGRTSAPHWWPGAGGDR